MERVKRETENGRESNDLAATLLSDQNFIYLCKKGTVEEIMEQIEMGANVNARGSLGDTPPKSELILR